MTSLNTFARPVGEGDWSSVRLYGQFFKDEDFTKEEYKLIADRFHFMAIEKRHAHRDYGKGKSEEATLKTAKKLKAINPDQQVLFYWNADLVYERLYASFKNIKRKHPTWLQESKFNVSSAKRGFDFSEQEARDFWVKTASEIIENPFVDGVFVDALPKAQSNNQLEIVHELMDQLPGTVIYNGFRYGGRGKLLASEETLKHADGVFVEAFLSASVDNAEKGELLIDRLLELPTDKYLICNGLLDGFGSKGSHEFSLAAYLIVTHEKAFYRLGEGHAFGSDHLHYWHEDFENKLGAPKGKATKKDGVYTRSFEFAEVELNLKEQTSKIDWKTKS